MEGGEVLYQATSAVTPALLVEANFLDIQKSSLDFQTFVAFGSTETTYFATIEAFGVQNIHC